MSHIFKILFQTGNVKIFVLRGVFFSRYAQIKSAFSDKKKSAVKSEKPLVEELLKFNVTKY